MFSKVEVEINLSSLSFNSKEIVELELKFTLKDIKADFKILFPEILSVLFSANLLLQS